MNEVKSLGKVVSGSLTFEAFTDDICEWCEVRDREGKVIETIRGQKLKQFAKCLCGVLLFG